MAKFTRKDVEDMYSIKPGTLRQYIRRGKLIEDETGYIDNKNLINERFLKSKERALQPTSVVEEVSAPVVIKKRVSAPVDVKKNKPVKRAKLTQREKDELSRMSLLDSYEIRTKKADAELKERTAELKKLEIEKKAGELLPVDLVRKIIGINNKSIFINMEQEIRNQAGMMAKDREELAILEKEMQKSLTISVKKAKDDMQAELENAINEFMDTRGRGQKT
jgi:hypothetical protein